MGESREYIWFDGEVVESEKAKISVKSHSLHYGTAVFEGIRAYPGDDNLYVFRLQEHMNRLLNSARMLHIKAKYSSNELVEATVELIRRNNYRGQLYIRPIIFLGDGGINLDYSKHPVHTSIFALPLASYFQKEGLRVCISSWRRISSSSMLPRSKASANYLNSCLATIEAKLAGYDEAILLDQNGYVSEGSGENVFIVKNDKVYTPDIYSSILEGVTRDSVFKIAEDSGIKVETRQIDRSELYTADEIFFTGTAAEITPVVEVDGRMIGRGEKGKITGKIAELYRNAATGKVSKYKNWLTQVYSK